MESKGYELELNKDQDDTSTISAGKNHSNYQAKGKRLNHKVSLERETGKDPYCPR
jgi:hypothetical protein